MQAEERREYLHKILDEIIDINGLQRSNQKKTGNHPTITADLMGHVGNIIVRVYETGWEPTFSQYEQMMASFEESNTYDNNVKELYEWLRKKKESLCV